jgi:hypothetical protein
VATIEYGVFYQCESLTTLTFPASVANIYPVQFYRSGITDLIFQDITSTWTISTEENGAGDIIDNNWQPTNDTEANRSKFTSNVFRNYYFTKN